MDRLIYLDNAATSFPKPEEVYRRMDRILREVGGNPGRAGHRMSIEANRVILDARESVSELFNIEDPSRVILTSSATAALNLGLKGFLRRGDHVVTSKMEHNSVVRPLNALEGLGVKTTKVVPGDDGILASDDIQRAIRGNTRLIVLTHASNVGGGINPIREIGMLARQRGIAFLVDAAQTAGCLPIDVEKDCIDMLACPGHKGLLGPQGTGFLCISPGITLDTIMEGGTGGNSEPEGMPEELPERYEAGTMNTPGIGGLCEGIRFILREGIGRIRDHERSLTGRLVEGLGSIRGIKIYGPSDPDRRIGVVSFNIEGKEASEVGLSLDASFGVMSRSGLHCAPDAHRMLGTFSAGTVRLSPGYFNTMEEVDIAVDAVKKIAAG